MSKKKHFSVLSLALLAALAASPLSALYFSTGETVLAQSSSPAPDFPLPKVVPTGATVELEGSPSMSVINQFLKQQYEKDYAGTTVNLRVSSTDESLAALKNGKIDLAATGRPLTQAEKAAGLTAFTLPREKIAIIVGPNNPFKGNLTFEQFAKIFRGEITNWAQLGGTPGPIRFIDRPETSDTRRAFPPYPVFKSAPFQAGANTTTIAVDDTAEIIKQLGNDGISYAPYSQVRQEGNVRIVPMHQTLPSDPRYPFSKPRYYVYKNPPTPPVAAFLGFASATPGQQAIAAASEAEAAAIAKGKDLTLDPAAAAAAAVVAIGATATAPGTSAPGAPASPPANSTPATGAPATSTPATGEIAPSPTPTAPDGAVALNPPPTGAPNDSRLGLLALLFFPLLIGLLWFWKGRRRSAVPPLETAAVPEAIPTESAAGLADPIANPVPAATPVVSPEAVRPPALGVTPLPSGPVPSVPPVVEVPPSPIPAAEIPVVEIPVVEIPPTEAVPGDILSAAVPAPDLPDINPSLAAGAVIAAAGAGAAIAGLVGGKDQTDTATRVEPGQNDVGAGVGLRGNSALAGVDDHLPGLPGTYGGSSIVLMPRDPQWAYSYWDLDEGHAATVRQQGGVRRALRFYDVTDVDINVQNPHSMQQYDCEEIARDWYIPVPVSDRDYLVEIGYLTEDGHWLMMARSAPIRIPPVYPSDYMNEQFLSMNWEEDLRGKTFMELEIPGIRPRTIHDTMYALALAGEAERVAGSIYSSMQTEASTLFPSGAGMMSGIGMMSGVGLYGMTTSGMGLMSGVGMGVPTMSGIGMSGVGLYGMTTSGMGMMSGIGTMSGVGMGVPTMSGIGMSGVGLYGMTTSGMGMMSGIGMMSGVGFGASMPPLRSRKFWLVADAELIIYGATEPDANVTIAGRPVQLNPDGTFRFQMSFPDGMMDFPILAVAVDGVQTRAIHMTFDRQTPTRNTNTKADAIEEILP